MQVRSGDIPPHADPQPLVAPKAGRQAQLSSVGMACQEGSLCSALAGPCQGTMRAEGGGGHHSETGTHKHTGLSTTLLVLADVPRPGQS